MVLESVLARASRGMRQEAGLHLVAISSLTVAFACLGAALLALTNLGAFADAWGRSARMSVYLRDGAAAADVDQLRMVIEGLPEIRGVEHLDSAEARARFLRDSDIGAELADLPPEAFPASLELRLAPGVAPARIDAMAERIRRFAAVEDVETYRGWLGRLDALLAAGHGLALVLGVLVVLCVVFVVGNTIRLVVAGRREEIEVMKLCGATDGFVRGPFIVEGAVHGLLSALAAIGLLLVAFVVLRDALDATLAGIVGTRVVFLHPGVVAALVLAGALCGATGSALSLRRYLAV